MAFCCFSAYTSLGSSTVNKGWVSLSYMAGRLPIPDRNNQVHFSSSTGRDLHGNREPRQF